MPISAPEKKAEENTMKNKIINKVVIEKGIYHFFMERISNIIANMFQSYDIIFFILNKRLDYV